MKLSPVDYPIRRLAIVLIPLLGGLCLTGMLWSATTLPETSRKLFGTVLAADLIRATIYGLGLLIPATLVLVRTRGGRSQLLRGAALAFAVAGGHALLSGGILALDRALPWPGLPDFVAPLISLCYACMILLAGHKWFLAEKPTRRALFGLGLGIFVSAGWVVVGSLGTWDELVVAFLESLANSLLAALLIVLLFFHDPQTVARRPVWCGLLAGAILAALMPSLIVVRGWSAQGASLMIPFLFYSFIAAALLLLDHPPQPRRAWWTVFMFLFGAMLLPFAFSDGADGDWIPGGLPHSLYLAGLFSMLSSIALAAILFTNRSLPERMARRSALFFTVSIVPLVLVTGVYVAFGRVGLQPQTFFVVMADQADTHFAQVFANRKQRIAAVYAALTTHALSSQAQLRAYLDAHQIHYRPYYLINGLEVEGGPILRRTLLQRQDVSRILDTPRFRPPSPTLSPTGGSVGRLAEEREKSDGPSWGILFIKADQAWKRWGITGEGITIGAIGSGVDWTHPNLRAQYLGSENSHEYTWFDPWEGTPEPVDSSGIGTHSLSTALGADGTGVAPGARWIACRSLPRDLGNIAFYLDCLQFLLAPFPQHGNSFIDGDPGRGVDIVNAAWNCPPLEGCDATTLSIAVEHLRNAGQMFVTGAGNNGPACGTIGSPGLAEAAFTVGAIDSSGTIADFSSLGPITDAGSERAKPDVVAPGVDILAALPSGRYAEFGGTAMASSHVAGLVALLWSANPGLIGEIDRTEQIIVRTAHYIPTSVLCGASSNEQNNVYGFGVVDAFEAVRMALKTP